MTKLTRDAIIAAALDLLDREGLDAISTRRLAERLQVASPALYWHFKDKTALLDAVAMTVMTRHHHSPPPDHDDWLGWFADNMRELRRALLAYRDGARLHAGTTPGLEGQARVAPKLAYLVRHGLSEAQAGMALYAAGQYTLGCVLEEQARQHGAGHQAGAEAGAGAAPHDRNRLAQSSEAAFEFGLQLLVSGLQQLKQSQADSGPDDL